MSGRSRRGVVVRRRRACGRASGRAGEGITQGLREGGGGGGARQGGAGRLGGGVRRARGRPLGVGAHARGADRPLAPRSEGLASGRCSHGCPQSEADLEESLESPCWRRPGAFRGGGQGATPGSGIAVGEAGGCRRSSKSRRNSLLPKSTFLLSF